MFIYEVPIHRAMARMHSRKKGTSSSTHPVERNHPEWSMSATDIEKRIVELAREGGQSQALIGITLRDSYGIPDIKAATGKKLSEILAEHNLLSDTPEDLDNLLTKRAHLKEHLADNPRDTENRRNLYLIEAKIRRLLKYYKRKGVVASDFRL